MNKASRDVLESLLKSLALLLCGRLSKIRATATKSPCGCFGGFWKEDVRPGSHLGNKTNSLLRSCLRWPAFPFLQALGHNLVEIRFR